MHTIEEESSEKTGSFQVSFIYLLFTYYQRNKTNIAGPSFWILNRITPSSAVKLPPNENRAGKIGFSFLIFRLFLH